MFYLQIMSNIEATLILSVIIMLLIFIVIRSNAFWNPPRIRKHFISVSDQIAQEINSTVVNNQSDFDLVILSGSIVTKSGNTLHDVLTASAEQKTVYELDAELSDSNGYPIFSGRITNLGHTEKFIQFEQWSSINGQLACSWRPEDQRTIGLAYDVFMELIQNLYSLSFLSPLLAEGIADPNINDLPMVYLQSIWPQEWTAIQLQSATDWLGYLLMKKGWPSGKLIINPISLDTSSDSLLLIDRINQHRQRNGSGLYLLISSQSYIGEQSIAAWEFTGQLLINGNKNGNIPGEASAGAILSDSSLATGLESATSVLLHPMAQQSHNKLGKFKEDTLVDTIKNALNNAKISADRIAKIFSSTGVGSQRVVELMTALTAVMKGIEPESDCFKLEILCGTIGVASDLAVLLSARHQVLMLEKAVLCICNNKDLRSVAAMVIAPVLLSTNESTENWPTYNL